MPRNGVYSASGLQRGQNGLVRRVKTKTNVGEMADELMADDSSPKKPLPTCLHALRSDTQFLLESDPSDSKLQRLALDAIDHHLPRVLGASLTRNASYLQDHCHDLLRSLAAADLDTARAKAILLHKADQEFAPRWVVPDAWRQEHGANVRSPLFASPPPVTSHPKGLGIPSSPPSKSEWRRTESGQAGQRTGSFAPEHFPPSANGEPRPSSPPVVARPSSWSSDRERMLRELTPFLRSGEIVVADAPAQALAIAEVVGRGGGEGRLFATSQRLIHWADHAALPTFAITRTTIERIETRRVVFFGMRELRLTLRADNGPSDRASFYVAKGAAKRLQVALRESESQRMEQEDAAVTAQFDKELNLNELRLRAARMHEAAVRAHDRGDTATARDWWKRVVESGLSEAVGPAAHNLGVLEMNAGRDQAASEWFELGAAGDYPPEACRSMVNLGTIAARSEDWVAANDWWRKALEADPSRSVELEAKLDALEQARDGAPTQQPWRQSQHSGS